MNLTNHRRLAPQLDRAAGHQGRGGFGRVLAGNPPATRSELEDRLYDLVLAAEFAAPDVNVALTWRAAGSSPTCAGRSSAWWSRRTVRSDMTQPVGARAGN